MSRITLIGRNLFAFACVASGLRQLATGAFIRLVPGTPAWLPWPAAWILLSGALLVVAGGALFFARWRRRGALVLGTMLGGLFLVLYLPQALGNPWAGFMWTNPCKTLALLGGALMLAGLPVETGPDELAFAPKPLRRLLPAGWIFLSLFFLVAGAQHFTYAAFVDTLVPAWIPPSRRFWTVFAGVALLAGGAGLALPRTARVAALGSGLMVFLWVFLLHLPRAVQMKSLFELDGVFEATAITGVAWLVAGTRPAAGKESAGLRKPE